MPIRDSFVAHIDILGMRSLTKSNPEFAWNVLSGLARTREHISNLQLTFIASGEQKMLAQDVFSVMFSDTIVLFTKGCSEHELQSILVATGELLHKAMFNLVPIRAGVTRGTFFFNIDESMYSGPALIEAYDLGEQAQWLGITVSETVFAQTKQAKTVLFQSGTDDIIIPAQIPTKAGPVSGFAMNWPVAYRHDFKVQLPISVELFYSQFEHMFGPFDLLREQDRAKYVNTTEFINACLR